MINLFKIIVFILLLIKCFTVVIQHKDDPTISIGIKLNPISENIVYQYDNLENKNIYFILWSDENETIGQNILNIIYKVPLIIYIISLIILFFLQRIKS